MNSDRTFFGRPRTTHRGLVAWFVPWLLLLAVPAGGCGPAAGTARESLLDYMGAVQERETDRLFCLSAGAAISPEFGADEAARRQAFAAWAEDYYRAYEEGREAGFVDPSADPLLLVKLFSLGRGTYFEIVSVQRQDADHLTARTDLRFGYGAIDLSRFSPGTTLYVCGEPAGRIEPIRVPAFSSEIGVTVLETIAVDWTLVRQPATAGCDEAWAVAAAEPVPGSAVAVDLTWAF